MYNIFINEPSAQCADVLNYKTKTLSGQLRELKNKGKVQLGNPQKTSGSLTEVAAYKSFSLHYGIAPVDTRR